MIRRLAAAVLAVIALPSFAAAQPRPKIPVTLEVRSEGQANPDATAATLVEEVRRGLSAIPDVEIVAAGEYSRRTLWIIAGAAAAVTAASVMVTERYDRETLMVLGIEDDETAFRMMALQIVSDHQIFTGPNPVDVAKRIVNALDAGVFTRLRKLPPRP
jgi:hypothetical protein